MLKKIKLERYRCYENHEVDFKEITIIVGKNNAGKSTLIEALRLVSLIRDRLNTGRYKFAPSWTQFPKKCRGISPSLERIDFTFKNVINQHEDPPAKILATFSTDDTIEIQIQEGKGLFAVARKKDGDVISSQKEAKNYKLPHVNILPQIGPLQKDERALDEDYVKSAVYSSLASRHFRNQLSYLHKHYKKFKTLTESSWENFRIISLTKAEKKFEVTDPYLLVQEGLFATEIGEMGHGLQMWLQTIWFLSRANPEGAVVLDEPDVYMHADLQRKLIRIVKNIFKQVIIATHSLEIMAEVEPDNILVIDRSKEKSFFAIDMPSVQQVIYNDIGSIHNLGLARLWSARKFLWVEGNDIAILKRLHAVLFPMSDDPIDKLPNSDMGGWGGWRFAVGSTIMLKNAGDETLKVYCIFDSDYHIPPDISKRYEEASKKSIFLHIWKKKELENYLIHPEVIYRTAIKNNPKAKASLNVELIINKINEVCENMKHEVEDDYSSEILKFYRLDNEIVDFMDSNKILKYEGKNANKLARKYVSGRWSEDKTAVVPGKSLIKELNRWLSQEHKCNVNANNLAIEFKKYEIDTEMKKVLTRIENLGAL